MRLCTLNTFENAVVQEQVVVQEIPPAPQVVDSFPLLGDAAAGEYNQIPQPLVIFQEIPEVQALNTSSTSTNNGVPAATHAAVNVHVDAKFPLFYATSPGLITILSSNRPRERETLLHCFRLRHSVSIDHGKFRQ